MLFQTNSLKNLVGVGVGQNWVLRYGNLDKIAMEIKWA